MVPLAYPRPATITAVHRENYRTHTLVLDARLEEVIPGQFVMAWLPRFDEKPFSLVDADPVTLMITAVGPFTRLVHTLAPGDRLWIRGPFGRGFRPARTGERIALVAGGYGVAPLLWLARTVGPQAGHRIAVLGARTRDDLLYLDRFLALAEEATAQGHAPLQVIPTTEDGSFGQPGKVTDALRPLLAGGHVDRIAACGPHGMLAALEEMAAHYRVEAELSWEAYMRCAMGLCGACEHRGALLCLDGPVLSA